MEVEVEQRVHLRIDDEHDAAAATAVAAVGAAERLELLAVDRRAAVAAVAGPRVDHDAVDEPAHGALLSRNMDVRAGGPRSCSFAEPRPRRRVVRARGLSAGTRHDVDRLATALDAELDRAGGRGEQRVVAAAADVDAGMEVGAALADDDLAGLDDLPAEPLDAEPLGVGVATVA